MSTYTVPELERIAITVRRDILEMLNTAGSGHAGGALGIVEVLVGLYFSEMNISPDDPKDPKRDRFVLSAAHMVPALYAVLAERGYMAKKELKTLRTLDSKLAGHTFRDLDIGVETTGGSLGQGMSIALGMALAAKISKETYRTYCVIGDGESNEGQIWEAAMFANKYELDNLCVILDRNHIQLSESTEVVMPIEPVKEKWEAFNWNVVEVDGNDISQVLFAYNKAKIIKGRPTLILANTIPGLGVSFMENKWQWHGKVPNDEELKLALEELKG